MLSIVVASDGQQELSIEEGFVGTKVKSDDKEREKDEKQKKNSKKNLKTPKVLLRDGREIDSLLSAEMHMSDECRVELQSMLGL